MLTCHFLLAINFFILSLDFDKECPWRCLLPLSISHGCLRLSTADILFLMKICGRDLRLCYILRNLYINMQWTYSWFFISNLEMKSLATCEISSNASSSKSQAAFVTLDSVSVSVSPMKGDSPDNLKCDWLKTQTQTTLTFQISFWSVFVQHSNDFFLVLYELLHIFIHPQMFSVQSASNSLPTVTCTVVPSKILREDNSQHIGDDTNTPHVGKIVNILITNDFWCNKLWCSKKYSHIVSRIVSSGQTKIYQLYL